MLNKKELKQFGILTDEHRQSGRTHEMLKKAIAKAVANPTKEVHVVFINSNESKKWVSKIKKENPIFNIPNLKFFTHTGHVRKYGITGKYGKLYNEHVFYDHDVISKFLKGIAKHMSRFINVNNNH